MSNLQPEGRKEADDGIANRFLAHQLSDGERVLFEAQLLVDPETVKESEATARFKVGLHKLREAGQLDALLKPPPRSYRTFAFAAAAVVVIGIAVAFSMLEVTRPALLVDSVVALIDARGKPLPISQPYALIRTRAATERALVQLPTSRQAIQLRLFPNLQARAPYRVSLRRSDGRALGTATVANADDDRFVTVFVDSARLERGNYRLTVAAAGDGAKAESYSFEVR